MFLRDSVRPHHAQMQLTCSAVVRDERGEPYILTLARHWDLLHVLRTGQSIQDLYFNHELELHGNALVGNQTRDLWHSRRALTR